MHGVPFDTILAEDFSINFFEAWSATVSDMLDLTKSFGLYKCVMRLHDLTLTIPIEVVV